MTYDQSNPGQELSAVENGLVDVVLEAKTKHFSVAGDYARRNAAEVGMAASMGLITTKIHMNVFGRDWLPTIKGLSMLSQVELDEDEA